jgi:hypothetical protein
MIQYGPYTQMNDSKSSRLLFVEPLVLLCSCYLMKTKQRSCVRTQHTKPRDEQQDNKMFNQ